MLAVRRSVIPSDSGKVVEKRRRREAIVKRYAFQVDAINLQNNLLKKYKMLSW